MIKRAAAIAFGLREAIPNCFYRVLLRILCDSHKYLHSLSALYEMRRACTVTESHLKEFVEDARMEKLIEVYTMHQYPL